MTTRTDGTDPSKAVVEQMIAEKRRRKNQPKPQTVISQDQTVQGSKDQGGPNPNEEGLPVRLAAVETAEADEPNEAVEAASGAGEDTSKRVDDLGGGTDEDDQSDVLKRPDERFGSKDGWFAYRLANGYSEDELKGLGRNKLRDLDDR